MTDEKPGADQAPTPQGDLLPSRKTGTAENIIIVLLIVGVGLLFGMTPVIAALQQPSVDYAGIPETVINGHQKRAQQLQQAVGYRQGSLSPLIMRSGGPQDLLMARKAENEGLQPKGDDLTDRVNFWLNQEVGTSYWGGAEGDNPTLRQLLSEQEDITKDDLRQYFSVVEGARALSQRYVVEPVVSTKAAQILAQSSGDKVRTTEVVISAAAVLEDLKEEAAQDQAALDEAYATLQAEYFTTPKSRLVSLFVADGNKIAKQIEVSTASAQARYEADKENYRLPTPAVAEGEEEPEPQYQPFAEVKDGIVATIKKEIGLRVARKLIGEFENEVRRLALTGNAADIAESDVLLAAEKARALAADFDGLNEDVLLEVLHEVRVYIDADSERLQLSYNDRDLGSLPAANSNLIAEPAPIGELVTKVEAKEGIWLMARLSGSLPAEAKKADDPAVREDLINYVAGQKAYGLLREKVEQLIANSEGVPLKELFASDEQIAYWHAELNQGEGDAAYTTQTPLKEYTLAGETPAQPGDTMAAIELAYSPETIFFTTADGKGDGIASTIPRLRLVQFHDYQGDDNRTEEQNRSGLSSYRRTLAAYQDAIFRERVAAEVSQR